MPGAFVNLPLCFFFQSSSMYCRAEGKPSWQGQYAAYLPKGMRLAHKKTTIFKKCSLYIYRSL